MRLLRLGLIMVAASAAVLTGCTDPSPDITPTSEAPPSEASTTPTDEPETTSEPSEEPSAPAAPVWGTAANQPSGAATACVADALGAQLTFSTVLTTLDAITLDSLTLVPNSGQDVEILDQYVLPFTAGAGGLAVGDYPPADPTGVREELHFLPLEADQSVIVGVGVSVQEPTTMTFELTYHGGDGVERTLTAPHQVTIADACPSVDVEPTETASD